MSLGWSELGSDGGAELCIFVDWLSMKRADAAYISKRIGSHPLGQSDISTYPAKPIQTERESFVYPHLHQCHLRYESHYIHLRCTVLPFWWRLYTPHFQQVLIGNNDYFFAQLVRIWIGISSNLSILFRDTCCTNSMSIWSGLLPVIDVLYCSLFFVECRVLFHLIY